MASATSISISPTSTKLISSASPSPATPFSHRQLLPRHDSNFLSSLRWRGITDYRTTTSPINKSKGVTCSVSSVLPSALLFDCDGVLVDTEKDGHRISFNDTFAEKELGVTWDVELYGELLKIGGGKERMTAYFNKTGWPDKAPKSEEERKDFIASLHKRKTELFMVLIEKKLLPLRPGVAKLIDQAFGKGVKVAVCSTSNEKAVSAIVSCLLGPERAAKIDIFAGDVVPRKKPDPAIYLLAASTLGVEPSSCVVVEDSAIGLAAAKAAGMKCIVTKSGYTADEDFLNADAVFDCIGDPPEERFDLAFCSSLLEKQYHMELQPVFIAVTSTAGFIYFTSTLLTFLRWIWVSFLRSAKNLRHYGSWALVTGSTDGIGKALAFELASKGLNLVLIGRNPSKLEHTSKEIREKHGSKVEIRNVVVDFAKDDGGEVARKIEEEISGLDVGLLVNNAGFSYPYAKYFHEIEGKMVGDIVKVNIVGATWVTRAVLPVMLQKKKGAIINIGSGSGSTSIVPSYPLYTVYAASKAYTGMFSRSMSLEYKQHGIDIQCQMPLLVATKMASIKRSSFFVPSPEEFSKASVRWIGYEHTCVPYWTHSIQCCLLRVFPDTMLNKVLLRYFLSVRKRGLLKDSVKNR